MPRKRTGTLVQRKTGWFGQVMVDVQQPDGTTATERRWFDLETMERATARRKLAKLVALLGSGAVEAVAKAETHAPVTVNEHKATFIDTRRRLGVRSVQSEEINFDRHILPIIGCMALADVRRDHVEEVLTEAALKGLAKGTVEHIKRLLVRFFNSAIPAIVAANPASGAKLPAGLKADLREPEILTDEEIMRFMESPKGTLEVKMATLVARTEGGMRTVELLRWDWGMIDRLNFAQCVIPRAKRGKPQTLQIPEVLRPFLRAWWFHLDRPEAGPVFPVQRGRRKGLAKQDHGNSYVTRLRRDLLRAGIKRHACTRPANADPPAKAEPCCEGYHRDPIYSDTAISRRADFHSFRRAFVSAVAVAGINMQVAMRLASHSNADTHMRYVMTSPAMQVIPEAALPRTTVVANDRERDELQRAGCKSPRDTTDRADFSIGAATGSDDASPRNDGANADSPVLPKLRVAGSSPVSRSIETKGPRKELQLTVAEPSGVSTYFLDDIGCPQPWPVSLG